MKRSLALAFALAALPAAADLAEGLRFLERGQPEHAYREFKASAEAGDKLSARAAGRMLERGVQVRNGQWVRANRNEAARWYRRAVELGDSTSAELLGVMLVGAGDARDIPEALRLFASVGRDAFALVQPPYEAANNKVVARQLIEFKAR